MLDSFFWFQHSSILEIPIRNWNRLEGSFSDAVRGYIRNTYKELKQILSRLYTPDFPYIRNTYKELKRLQYQVLEEHNKKILEIRNTYKELKHNALASFGAIWGKY